MTPLQKQLQERLDRQYEDACWNEHRAQDALRAKQIHEQRIQDDLGLLRPGERIIDGKVMFSSMWLDCDHSDFKDCRCGWTYDGPSDRDSGAPYSLEEIAEWLEP